MEQEGMDSSWNYPLMLGEEMKRLLTTLLLMLGLSAPASADPAFSLGEDVLIVEGVVARQMSRLANDLLKIKHDDPGTIDIVINSPGGSVYSGWVFINAMRIMQDRGYTLRCTVTTMAASMAYQILAECDKRYAFAYSTLLWHPVRIQGMFTLTPKEAIGLMKQLMRIEKQLVNDLRAKFDVSDKEFWSHYHAETLHIAAQLVPMSGNFITIVDDIGGVESLSNLTIVKKNTKIKPRTMPGPKKSISPSPYRDAFIYMNSEALRIWQLTN